MAHAGGGIRAPGGAAGVTLTAERDLAALRVALAAWLQRRLPQAAGLEVSALVRPSAGLSNETLLFCVSWRAAGAARSEDLVARLMPAGPPVFPEYDLARQYRVMEALGATDVPVPRVRWFEADPRVLGCPFYVMARVTGDIPSEVPAYHAYGFCFEATPVRRARLWWSGIETLARIHRLDWRRLGLDFLGVPGAGTDPLDRQLDYYARYLDWAREGAPQPILAAALAWLREHRYAPARVTLCWGDARLPNVVFRDDAVAAVLDWEMAFLGDPEADLGWWLFFDWHHSEGYGIPRLAGFAGVEETVARYEALTGWRVEHARYNEVLAAFRFGVILLRLARNMRAAGVLTPAADRESNNACTRRLAALLGLPPPGTARGVTRLEEASVRVQFHLTGPDGGDWYLVSENGRAARHEGTVADPDTTVTAAAADWLALRRGELDRVQAFLGGKLRIEGDMTLLLQLEEAIARLGDPAARA
jgi:aminoglycoside phosphotransferase (APT) family kinase protein/putative sterol carrier protein